MVFRLKKPKHALKTSTGTKERETAYEKGIRLFKDEGCEESLCQVSQETDYDKAEFQYNRVLQEYGEGSRDSLPGPDRFVLDRLR